MSQPAALIAPDVGTLFIYGERDYRLTGWACPVRPTPHAYSDPVTRLIAEIVAEEPHEPRFRWCSREEATHVTGTGVCGCLAPLGEIHVRGRVPWSEDEIARHRARAERLGAKGYPL